VNSIRAYSKHILALCLALCLAGVAVGLPPNLAPVPTTSVESITSTELRMHLEFLASDELGGRYTLAPNFGIVARYLAAHLKAYGFRGAGDHGDFLQHFAVTSSKPDIAATTLAVTLNGKTSEYNFGDFYQANGADGKAEGPIVFVGTGVSSASLKHDDYAGLDVKGKIALIAPGIPAGIDRSKLRPEELGERAAYAHGAAGVMQIPSQRLSALMKDAGFKERAAQRENVRLTKESEGRLPAVMLGPALAEKILTSVGLTLREVHESERSHKPLVAKALDASAHMNVVSRQTQVTTQNVAGVLKGADPKLKNEYVVFSAHYDHLATNDKGEIYPGADDDGSGVTAVLAIAHALSMDRPKRSVLVIFHAGEELGLLGSEYNTDFSPAVPLDRIVTDLNIDMIGRSKPPGDNEREDEHLSDANTVYLVGSNRISRELHQISEETNSEFQKLNLDYYYNDPAQPERIYYRSDHWNYAKHGIPVIFYFDGIHVDYHKPTDTVDKIDFNKLTRVTRLVFETGWRVANLDHELARNSN
jgi:Peptidase family M28